MVETTQGKKKALAALAKRRAKFKDSKAVDNSASYAGSPMYFRCISCGDPQGICVPESYLSKPILCGECNALKQMGWME